MQFPNSSRIGGGYVGWPGGRPSDAPKVQEPRIVELLEGASCAAKWTSDGWAVINERGDAVVIPANASLTEWKEAIEQISSHG